MVGAWRGASLVCLVITLGDMDTLPVVTNDALSDALIRRLIGRDDPIIFDIGCHDGGHTRWFLDLFPKARVHGFEPDVPAIARF